MTDSIRYIINTAELQDFHCVSNNIYTEMHQFRKAYENSEECPESIYITKLTGEGREHIFSKFKAYFDSIDKDRNFPPGTMLKCWKGIAMYSHIYKPKLCFKFINFIPYIYRVDGKTYQRNFVRYEFVFGDTEYWPIDFPISYKYEDLNKENLEDMIYEIKHVE